MKKRVFIDTDVILDVALARKDFLAESKAVLAMAENRMFAALTSVLVVSNLYYILRKAGGSENAKKFIRTIMNFIDILPADGKDIENALKSDFPDFEDAVQNSVLSRNSCDITVTRNVEDFRKAENKVFKPVVFLKLFSESF
jgi:predicted nucleic acid-binding protein